MFSAVQNVSFLTLLVVQYALCRARLRRRPPAVDKYYSQLLDGLDTLFGWTRGARFHNPENCPDRGPAIFAANHVQVNDPFAMGVPIHRLSGGIRPGAMMRDDFFRGFSPLLKRIVDPDWAARLVGAVQISRQGATPEQLDQFVQLLLDGGAFLIYPGRTRSRSGLIIEYRDWFNTPGRTSMFPSLVREREKATAVPVIPINRTENVVTGRLALAFGSHMFLPADADRAAQQVFDRDVVVAIGELVEVNAPHLLSVWMYLHCLHARGTKLSARELASSLGNVAGAIGRRNPKRLMDPALTLNPQGEVDSTVRFLEKAGLVQRHGDEITLNAPRILSCPQSLSKYKAQNPVKYLVNQVIHLADVTGAVEQCALASAGSGTV